MQEGNKLIVSVAGSGKTTFIVNQALSSKDKKVLLTTYTQANKDEIISKIIELNGVIPSHIEVETWFSFLFRHGVKPYQGSVTAEKIKGIFFVSSLSGIGIPESNIKRYYFCDQKIYSDKLSKFVIRSDDATGGSVISRLSRIYDAIYIDEAQDMCGYDVPYPLN